MLTGRLVQITKGPFIFPGHGEKVLMWQAIMILLMHVQKMVAKPGKNQMEKNIVCPLQKLPQNMHGEYLKKAN